MKMKMRAGLRGVIGGAGSTGSREGDFRVPVNAFASHRLFAERMEPVGEGEVGPFHRRAGLPDPVDHLERFHGAPPGAFPAASIHPFARSRPWGESPSSLIVQKEPISSTLTANATLTMSCHGDR